MSHDKLPQLESLELRRMFVAGTAGNDVIEILIVNASDRLTYRAVVNGVTAEQKTLSPDDFLTVDALGGDDLITTDPMLGILVRVNAGDGNDTIVGGARQDILLGQEGDDLLFGKLGSDTLVGGAGNDTLRGGDSSDVLRGDGDVTFGDFTTIGGDDFLFGEDGEDLLYAGSGNDTLNGDAGNDILNNDAGNDFAFGGDGNDSISFVPEILGDPSAQNDTLDGGDGIDELVVASSHVATYITLDGVANDGRPGDGTNVLPTFEAFSSSGLAPGSVIDFSDASGGVTMRYDDQVTETPPLWVTFIGSPFADTFVMTTPLVRVQVDGRDGDDTITGGGENDTLLGGAGNDHISGNGGADVILGEDGNDLIEGNGGSDHIAAGLGDDVVYGDFADGTADYGSDTIEGNAGNDVLVGGGNNDVIIGEGGRDTIIGGGGNDRMFNGPGVDKIFGGPGNDAAERSDQDLFNSVEVML